jgi:hypothetical protein
LQSILGRQRVRFSPEILLTRPREPRTDDSLVWLQQHSLESYSVGLEFLSQSKGVVASL